MVQKNILEVLGEKKLFLISSLITSFIMVSCSNAAVRESDILDQITQGMQEKVKIEPEEVVQEEYTIFLQKSMTREPKLCAALERGFKEWKINKFGFCGVPHPIADKDFTFRDWQVVDNKEHIHIIEQMFLWGSYRRYDNFMGSGKIAEFARNGGFPEEMVQNMLGPLKEDLHNRLNKITLEKARFDINFDGKKDDIYRMTPIMGVRIVHNSKGIASVGAPNQDLDPENKEFSRLFVGKEKGRPCQGIGLPGQTNSHSIYFTHSFTNFFTSSHKQSLGNSSLGKKGSMANN
jgi:hypothetical protein